MPRSLPQNYYIIFNMNYILYIIGDTDSIMFSTGVNDIYYAGALGHFLENYFEDNVVFKKPNKLEFEHLYKRACVSYIYL